MSHVADPSETGEPTTLGEELVRLASADNFRDVAGLDAPYVAADGVPLRRGVLFRSNELPLSAADVDSISALGVTAVYDLRHDHEIEAHPDVPIPGAEWHHLEVKGIPMDAVSDLGTRAAGTEVMHEVYRSFVDKPGARAAFSELLTRIAETDGAQLFHCTAGKDRTGWASALLLHVAGVDDETIMADYLLTNDFSSGTRQKYLGLVAEHLGADKVEVYERVMVADPNYLRTAYAAADAAYGDRAGYLRDGLGLGADVLAAVRRELRADPAAGRCRRGESQRRPGRAAVRAGLDADVGLLASGTNVRSMPSTLLNAATSPTPALQKNCTLVVGPNVTTPVPDMTSTKAPPGASFVLATYARRPALTKPQTTRSGAPVTSR